MRHTLIRFCLLFIISTFPVTTPAVAAFQQAVIEKANGDQVLFQVELARTEAEQQQGLMFRKELKQGYGMLFLFHEVKLATFWMKNTLIPLDIIFFDNTGQVIAIQENLKPNSLEYISSGGYTKAALEVPAGTVKKYGFTTKDKLLKPALQ